MLLYNGLFDLKLAERVPLETSLNFEPKQWPWALRPSLHCFFCYVQCNYKTYRLMIMQGQFLYIKNVLHLCCLLSLYWRTCSSIRHKMLVGCCKPVINLARWICIWSKCAIYFRCGWTVEFRRIKNGFLSRRAWPCYTGVIHKGRTHGGRGCRPDAGGVRG